MERQERETYALRPGPTKDSCRYFGAQDSTNTEVVQPDGKAPQDIPEFLGGVDDMDTPAENIPPLEISLGALAWRTPESEGPGCVQNPDTAPGKSITRARTYDLPRSLTKHASGVLIRGQKLQHTHRNVTLIRECRASCSSPRTTGEKRLDTPQAWSPIAGDIRRASKYPPAPVCRSPLCEDHCNAPLVGG